MTIISLNDNNEITNILKGIPGGKLRKCILTNENIERLSPIIRLAHNLELKGSSVFIEVKFQSQFSQRYKRLEIVSLYDKKVSIYKFSKKSSFEKECLEVQRVIDELKEISTSHSFHGFVVLSDFEEDIAPFENRVNEITSDISLIKE